MNLAHVIIFGAVLALAGCSRSSVVSITNRSAITVSNLVVSGSGFTNRIESLAPGAVHRLAVHPQGESGLRVAFDAAGQNVDSGVQGYFEAEGYQVSAVIGAKLTISITTGLDAQK